MAFTELVARCLAIGRAQAPGLVANVPLASIPTAHCASTGTPNISATDVPEQADMRPADRVKRYDDRAVQEQIADPAVREQIAELFGGSADDTVTRLLRMWRDARLGSGIPAALADALEADFSRGKHSDAVLAALVVLLAESPTPVAPEAIGRYAMAERGAMVVARRVARLGFGDGEGAVPASFGEAIAAAAAAAAAAILPGWSTAGEPAEQCDPTQLAAAIAFAGALYSIADDLGHAAEVAARPSVRRAIKAAQRCRSPLSRGRAGAASRPAPGAALAVAIAVGDVDTIHDIFGELGIAGALSPASAEAARRALAGHSGADIKSAAALAAWGVDTPAIDMFERLCKKINV